MFKESYNVVVKGITEIACDELGEFAGEGITKLIFNSNSKPEENYKEIVYEESLENNFLTYTRNIFSIPYLNDKLEKLTEQITELQQSLSESNIALNQERKKVIHFSNEIDTHKCKINKNIYNIKKNSKNKGWLKKNDAIITISRTSRKFNENVFW